MLVKFLINLGVNAPCKMTQTTQAIQAILQGNWEEAIHLNLALVKENPQDIECLNRLAFAYAASGNIDKAKTTYRKVLKLDDSNPIALKHLKRLLEGQTKKVKVAVFHIDNTMFLEEVGKTKVISLINTAPPRILRTLRVGEPVTLCIKRLKIFVLNQQEQFLGMLPDNISRRLIKFMKGGNKYIGYIKSVEEANISVFLKETDRAARFRYQPSFMVSDSPRGTIVIKKQKHYEEEMSEE